MQASGIVLLLIAGEYWMNRDVCPKEMIEEDIDVIKTKSPGEPGDLLCGWVSKYREINFPPQY